MEAVTIYTNGQMKQVGAVEEKTYIKKVNRKKHFLRNYGGYAIQRNVLDVLKEKGIELIEVHEDSGDIFSISFARFIEHGIEFNYGAGKQVVVPEKWWTKENKKQFTMEI